MALKHYIIALRQAFTSDTGAVEKGSIVSQHTGQHTARARVEKLNKRHGVSSRRPDFGVCETELVLAKGTVDVGLADKWLAQKFDDDAMNRPGFEGGSNI